LPVLSAASQLQPLQPTSPKAIQSHPVPAFHCLSPIIGIYQFPDKKTLKILVFYCKLIKKAKIHHSPVTTFVIQVPQALDFTNFVRKTLVSFLNPQEPEWKPR